MVKVTFLSDSGKVLASSERSVSMNFQKIDRPLHIFSVINLDECFVCDVQYYLPPEGNLKFSNLIKLTSTENMKVAMNN